MALSSDNYLLSELRAANFIDLGMDYVLSNYEWDGDDAGFILDEVKQWSKDLEEKMRSELKASK
ncbi:hypothetical protein [Neobacillus cucumis]|uniref:hypothetical protein n=1 Tax=Neobacillus cucumis TaxID=1740721 RepID=UPI002E20BCC3|nr:hypothetical protein [Neobacillus cucumis]